MLDSYLLVDVTKLSSIQVGMTVKIKVLHKNNIIGGKVYEIFSKEDDHDGIIVLITSGFYGHVLSIHNVIDEIKERILKNESHNSENKEDFYEPIMREHVIPTTVQSFLNSNGGYLYIGIYDHGTTPSEKFRGLDKDREHVTQKFLKSGKLQPGEILSDTDFFNEYQSDIEKALDKYLISDNSLGPLIDYGFPIIDGVTILEIAIRASPNPVFSNKSEEYQLYKNGQKVGQNRTLDTFFFRDGSRKKPVETFQEFFKYLKDKSN